MIAALAGGVGGSRLLSGLVAVAGAEHVVAVVNTGDDDVMHGLHISPDIDTVTYTLAGAVNPETGWGLAKETWVAMEALERYGGQTWFRLGDRDLATHLYRTQRLADGATLSEVTAEIAAAWGVRSAILPMSDDSVRTRVTLAGGQEVAFQEYFVRLRHEVEVSALVFSGAEAARPAPGVLDAIASAEVVVACPSNPLVSLAPILAVPGVREALRRRREAVVAVSPIVAGQALRGPAARLLRELGHDASALGVARLYCSWAGTLVVDTADRDLACAVETEGMRCVVTPTIMSSARESAALAEAVLAAGRA